MAKMKHRRHAVNSINFQQAFTLIEVLVVISIIAILTGLISALGAHSAAKRKIARAQAELQQLEAVIENYKSKLGFYPPDNGAMTATDTNVDVLVASPNMLTARTNQLLYELTGTVLVQDNPPHYETLTSSEKLLYNDASKYFGRGFANSGSVRKGVKNFFTSLKSGQYKELSSSGAGASPHIDVLTLPIDGPNMLTNTTQSSKVVLNTWRYNSSFPVNNPGSYDLWAEITIDGKVLIIGNWNSY
ncbi:MAG: hypothetical protein JWM04_2066 [Verrucomicrobiales bacterium]|nr:hypothetical protein [Verrucomicrobiales bacterium]